MFQAETCDELLTRIFCWSVFIEKRTTDTFTVTATGATLADDWR